MQLCAWGENFKKDIPNLLYFAEAKIPCQKSELPKISG